MNSPGTILKLWNKAVKKHEEGKKPAEMAKKGQDQKFKVKKGLTQLKFQGAADLSQQAHKDAFVGLRDKVAKLMKKYCRYLKSSKDEDKKALPRFLKNVKQLTVLVQNLDPGAIDQNEDEVGLEGLDQAVQADALQALDQALEQPDTEPDADLDEPLPQDMVAGQEEATEAPAPAPTGMAAVTRRLQALTGPFKDAVARKAPDVARMQTLFGAIKGLLDNKDYEHAGKVLDELEPLLAAAGTSTAEEATPPAATGLASWQAARTAAVNQLRKLSTAVARTKDPDAGPVVVLLEAIAKNLPVNPATPQAVTELEKWLKEDDVISAAEEAPPEYGTVRLREPLLKALEQLKKGSPA